MPDAQCIARRFQLAQLGGRFQQRTQQAFFILRVPMTHAAMRLIEASRSQGRYAPGQTDRDAQSHWHCLGFIIQQHYVIAVPANRTLTCSSNCGTYSMAAEILSEILQSGGSARRPGTAQSGGWWLPHVKLIGANRVALCANAKQLLSTASIWCAGFSFSLITSSVLPADADAGRDGQR